MESSIPEEIVYSDNYDFITEIEKTNDKIYEKAKEIMKSKNLSVNEKKTEYSTVKRWSKEEEREWRNVIKLESKLGDREGIQKRKELATFALAKNDVILKKNWKMKLTTRIRLYETLVKSVLLYNCWTWFVSKDDQRKLNSFHRRQLRKVIGTQWPHKISNNKLYKITGTKPLSITMTERKWKLLGHILRLPAKDCQRQQVVKSAYSRWSRWSMSHSDRKDKRLRNVTQYREITSDKMELQGFSNGFLKIKWKETQINVTCNDQR